MYCTYCGQKSKDGSSFCPYCGKQLHSQKENPNFDQSPNQQNSRMEYQREQKRSRWRLKLLLWLLACVVMTLGTICMLLYFEIADIPMLREIMSEIFIVHDSKSDEATSEDVHKHIWIGATCTSLRTCEECGETEGSLLEHQWVDATCDNARACSGCGKTDGTALGHQWIEATCTSPMTCAVCSQVQGNEYGHQWNPADYQSPKTCVVCGETEGRSLGYNLNYCTVTSNSNEKNSNSDVALGTWKDKFGQSYASSLRFWVADFGVWSDTEWIEYDINGQFQQLDITAAAEAGSATGTCFQVMVYGDGKLIYTSEWISYDVPPVQATIDIQNCSRLRIVCTTDSQTFCYGIVQGMLFN